MFSDSHKTEIVTAVALIVVLLGTATGNAYVMLAMSATALILLAVVFRRQIAKGAILLTVVAAALASVMAALIGFAVAMQ